MLLAFQADSQAEAVEIDAAGDGCRRVALEVGIKLLPQVCISDP